MERTREAILEKFDEWRLDLFYLIFFGGLLDSLAISKKEITIHCRALHLLQQCCWNINNIVDFWFHYQLGSGPLSSCTATAKWPGQSNDSVTSWSSPPLPLLAQLHKAGMPLCGFSSRMVWADDSSWFVLPHCLLNGVSIHNFSPIKEGIKGIRYAAHINTAVSDLMLLHNMLPSNGLEWNFIVMERQFRQLQQSGAWNQITFVSIDLII